MATDPTPFVSPVHARERADAIAATALSPAEALFGIRVTGSAPGRVTGSCVLPGAQITGPATPLGYVGALLDLCAGRSVRTTLGKDFGCRTASLRIDAAGAFPEAGQRVEAHAEALESFAGTVLAGVRLTDPAGAVIARCTGRFAIVPEQPEQRAAETLSDAVLTRLLGEIGEARDPREIKLALSPELANQYGIMHGGVQAFLSGAVLRNLASAEAGDAPVALDLTVRYHRPVVVSGPPILVRSAVERRGRKLSVVRTSAADTAGKPLFTARATFGAAQAGPNAGARFSTRAATPSR
ncbi:PaaI family thioesterase [Amycolatopsis sp.]|uniref:PaaI family thioesterase n=1 Tax=Amycolatopsis sp. TaxID=37632 RepID=UPI002C481E6C|nr:acyl-CoA thioesterase domain-containing protein [Amycolatopsis sp.]HVV11238.1 acyl-CoA thioesterase domain-containing protein [Amycolatopsis sp.]